MATTTAPLSEDQPGYVSDDRFEEIWKPPPGLWGWLTTVQNGYLGMRFIAMSLLFFVLGGIVALLMRTQLAVPENTLLDPETYNRFFTMHGSTMMFLFTIPLVEGIATLVLPQMLGSRELPFPRLTAFAFWSFLLGGLIFYASFFFNAVPDGGWFAYVPLTNTEYSPDLGMDFWLLGLNVAEIGAIAGAFEIIIAFFKMRAPGMTLSRIPIFAWAMMVTAFMMIFAFTPLIVGSLMLEIDRKFGTNFYRPEAGGNPLLWQHIFWIFGHPDVYIQFIPAVGIVSTVVPVFARRRLIGHNFVIVSLVATGFLSFGLWVHHMFTTGLPELSLSFFTAASIMIAIPSGVQVFAWITTIWNGKPVWTTSFLFIIGFLVNFVLGGLTGVMVAVMPFDMQVHDSYFVVAHFHYVLIGGVVFPIFAGIYYWAPKYIERMLSERLGKINFWLVFIGFNLTFFPMHISGFLGMPRRVYTYQEGRGLESWNMLSTIGAYVLALGILVFIINYIWTMRSGEKAPANPWNADTLDWATPTPMPQYGFRTLPIVHSRSPVWDQEALSKGDERTEKLVHALARWPIDWRSQLVTSTLDAHPQEVFRVAGPSIWPLVASAGLMMFSFFLIFDLITPAAISIAITVIGLLGWHGQDYGVVTRHTQRDEEFEREHGIPVRAEGSRGVSRAAMLLTIATVATGTATLLFSYLYLRLDQPQWPPEGIPLPNIPLPAVALAAIVLGSVGMWWAARGVRRDTWGAVRGGLAVAVLTGLVYIALQLYHLTLAGFNHQSQAYGSLYFIITIVQAAVIGGGLLAVGATLFWALRSKGSASEQNSVTDLSLYWIYGGVSSVLVFVTLYVLPYVI